MKRIYLLSLFFVIVIINYSCKKEDKLASGEIRFKYNGNNYTSTSNWKVNTLFDVTSFRFLYTGGIVITRSDLFQGSIVLTKNGGNVCAFLQPDGYSPIISTSCSLNVAGAPVDSTKVYWMESASYDESISGCGPTNTGPFKLCTMTATFSATLVNKLNQRIAITDGRCKEVVTLRQ